MTDQDLQLFNEYFQLEHRVNVNITLGGDWSTLPSDEAFDRSIPVPYKIASEMKGMEQTMLRPLRQLGDVIEPLANYLKAQSRKIDLMMSYILQSEDETGDQYTTFSYGGGGFTFYTDKPWQIDQWFTCKLFFDDEATAVFCLSKLVSCEDKSEEDEVKYLNTMVFRKIREEDRESIVRASLHQQSKQLLKKTQSKSLNQDT
ncbi:PilZ domain-containing protein [Psychrosphaera sp. B3R10]|uniref:PilZ domain-containing protein n=1 Tax=unclassified Psychrosphaera TaxID=2641570 RepID=UPI001C0A5694|nr:MULTISPECIES: PilZ domain-containing protein [unclassified Psychrosphaera]MBU2881346.1 PilZ domain-containing protein [Psychrosphaera sp. I2R16]MBU2988445.1 PilZ domain-containing protein [Psychrosphaera sp. B3R10]MDO6720055.1 PilZ domain-containing protein [Psychrosphaera sp. 1_MG-2023]